MGEQNYQTLKNFWPYIHPLTKVFIVFEYYEKKVTDTCKAWTRGVVHTFVLMLDSLYRIEDEVRGKTS